MNRISEVQNLIAQWWQTYDEGDFKGLAELLTDGATFECRTDTGDAEWEEFVRADLAGRDEVMAWQITHREGSPYPLRHNGTNVCVIDDGTGVLEFKSYMFVTQVVAGLPSNLSSGIFSGSVVDEGGTLRFGSMRVVLDTQDSVTFSER